jgi:isochorismate synthase
MKMNNFFSKIKLHKAQNLPFVLYSKPNSKNLIVFLQQNDTLYKFRITAKKDLYLPHLMKNN